MPTNSLSDAKCKAVRPADKAIKLFDGGGLYLVDSEYPSSLTRWRKRLKRA